MVYQAEGRHIREAVLRLPRNLLPSTVSVVKCSNLKGRFSLPYLVSGLLVALAVSGEARLTTAKTAPARWETLKGCHLMTDKYRDGDSFHVNYSGKEFVFRLYFVDAPEMGDE